MFNASMNFNLGEEIEAIRDTVRRFASEERPRRTRLTRLTAFQMTCGKKWARWGYMVLRFPKQMRGGNGLSGPLYCYRGNQPAYRWLKLWGAFQFMR